MARFICEICEHEVDPKASNVLHLITCWVKGGSNSIRRTETQHYRFVHDFCQRPANDDQLSLF